MRTKAGAGNFKNKELEKYLVKVNTVVIWCLTGRSASSVVIPFIKCPISR